MGDYSIDFQRLDQEDWENILVHFPDEASGGVFLSFTEGTGDNLLPEDIEDGYVDYVNWTKYRLSNDLDSSMFTEFGFKEVDGGMLLTKEYVKDIPYTRLVRDICRQADIKEYRRWSVAVSN